MLPLHTARLTLRRLQDSDLQELVAYRSLPQVMEWQLWDSYDLAKGRELIAECQDLQPFTAGSWFQYAVEHQGQLIGDLYMRVDTSGHQAEIGYTFNPRYQGQGLATEAVRALLDYAFKVVGLHRIYGITDPRHQRSIALMQRLGMRQEAHFKQSIWFKNHWADDVLFAILRSEWPAD